MKAKTNTYIYPNLRKEIGLKGLSLNYVADFLNISIGSLRNKLSDVTKFNIDEAKRLAIFFNKTMDELFIKEEI